jgi:hypothetical protein
MSADVESYDRAWELEKLGAAVIAMLALRKTLATIK